MNEYITKYEQLLDVFEKNKMKRIKIITGSIDASFLRIILEGNNKVSVFLTCYCHTYISLAIKYPDKVFFYSRFTTESYKNYFVTLMETEIITGKIDRRFEFKQLFVILSSGELISNHKIELISIDKGISTRKVENKINDFFHLNGSFYEIPTLMKIVNATGKSYRYLSEKVLEIPDSYEYTKKLASYINFLHYKKDKESLVYIAENLQSVLAIKPYEKNNEIFINLIDKLSTLMLAKIFSKTKELDKIINSKKELKNVIKNLLVENCKLNIQYNKLLLSRATSNEEIEKLKKTIKEYEAKLELLQQRTVNQNKANFQYSISENQQTKMKNDYKEAVKIVHPDVIKPKLRVLGTKITEALNIAYTANDSYLITYVHNELASIKDEINNHPLKLKKIAHITLLHVTLNEEIQKLEKLSSSTKIYKDSEGINKKIKTIEEENKELSTNINTLKTIMLCQE